VRRYDERDVLTLGQWIDVAIALAVGVSAAVAEYRRRTK